MQSFKNNSHFNTKSFFTKGFFFVTLWLSDSGNAQIYDENQNLFVAKDTHITYSIQEDKKVNNSKKNFLSINKKKRYTFKKTKEKGNSNTQQNKALYNFCKYNNKKDTALFIISKANSGCAFTSVRGYDAKNKAFIEKIAFAITPLYNHSKKSQIYIQASYFLKFSFFFHGRSPPPQNCFYPKSGGGVLT